MPDQILRALTQGAYDLQKVRIGVGNRICQAWYQASGVEPGTKPEDQLEEADQKLLDAIRADYRRVTDGLVRLPSMKAFKATPHISSYAVLRMVQAYEQTLKAEESAMAAVADQVEQAPIWQAFLKDVRGCGPTMAAVLLSRLDIHKAERISQFWRFAGYAVESDGRGQSKRSEHLVDRTYVSAAGEESVRKSITFDPWLKTKLYVLAASFLKDYKWQVVTTAGVIGTVPSWAGELARDEGIDAAIVAAGKKPSTARRTVILASLMKVKAGQASLVPVVGHYRAIYDGYKDRLEMIPPPGSQQTNDARPQISTVDWSAANKGHKHAAAMRYMIKQFLADLWVKWREVEGLSVTLPYAQAKLGLPPHSSRAA